MLDMKLGGELLTWLTEKLSKSLRVSAKDLDPDTPFARYGLESIDAVILAMEIEEHVGFSLPPTLLWDHNTVNECADFLRKMAAEEAA